MTAYGTKPGGWRAILILGLFVLVLLLVLGLAWQARQSDVAHNRTAAGILEDYARLAADEFSRRAMATVGYYGYYEFVNGLRASRGNDASQLVNQDSVAAYVFRAGITNEELHLIPDRDLDNTVREHVLGVLAGLGEQPLPESGFVINHTVIDGRQRTFVITRVTDNNTGFEVRPGWLSSALRETFANNTLLPSSLADGAISNDFIYLRMTDSAGSILFESGVLADEATSVTKHLTDEYEGVFRDHAISVAIEPGLAGSLVIGGLPGSRLPYTIALTVLAAVLLIAGVWQLYRENAMIRMRSNFVAEVSHELRTPLTQLRMFSESLLLRRLRSDDDRQRALTIINREAQRLGHMVENILRFSRRTPLAMTDQDLESIVRSVVEDFRVLVDDTSIRFDASIESGVTATADADALRQVLINLFDNAIKYGPDAQTITVTLERKGRYIEIAIDDEGPGIPDEEREHVWDGYYRLDRERDAAIAGTGIGLAVVKDIVDRHGGHVRIGSSPTGGARFVVELPA